MRDYFSGVHIWDVPLSKVIKVKVFDISFYFIEYNLHWLCAIVKNGILMLKSHNGSFENLKINELKASSETNYI